MKVTEMFLSVQGEGLDAGRLCTFVRFTACNVRCGYCDTDYSFYGGEEKSMDQVVEYVTEQGAPSVCLTGGEPMLQSDIPDLMERLLAKNLTVLLETNGIIPLDKVPRGVVKIVDIKTPGAFRPQTASEDYATSPAFLKRHFHYPNLETLKQDDQIKFVLCDREDYDWAKEFMKEHDLNSKVDHVLFSPSHEQLEPRVLVDWMTTDRVPARLNLQVHKYIWGTDVRGV
jgi:7-carboxy-7-deazaguanine synthase